MAGTVVVERMTVGRRLGKDVSGRGGRGGGGCDILDSLPPATLAFLEDEDEDETIRRFRWSTLRDNRRPCRGTRFDDADIDIVDGSVVGGEHVPILSQVLNEAKSQNNHHVFGRSYCIP